MNLNESIDPSIFHAKNVHHQLQQEVFRIPTALIKQGMVSLPLFKPDSIKFLAEYAHKQFANTPHDQPQVIGNYGVTYIY
jgi:hypothetical protein